MNKTGYYISKFKYRIFKDYEAINDFYRRGGVKIGKNCIICGYMSIGEPFLVEIRDNCVISNNVNFITHDHSISKVLNKSNLFGRIIVGNNCFVGQGSTILYGIELADNIIVASGSVVTKSFFDENTIIGGNPAKVIGTWDNFAEKYADKAANRNELPHIIMGGLEYKLVRR